MMYVKPKILVIDDELGIREGCRRVLQPLGYEVHSAESFQVGLSKIQTEPYDLILIDVMMPDGRGIDLLNPIHQKDPEAVSLIITGYATTELAIEAIKRGAYDFISKPFDSDVLTLAVNQGLEKRRLSLEAKRLQIVEEQAAELARAKAVADQLNEFKSNFMLVVAHELRSPISGAQSLVRTLLRGFAGDLNEQQNQILTRIEARLDFFTDLINDVITLAASKTMTDTSSLTPIGVQSILNKIIDRFIDEANNKQIKMNVNLPEHPLYINATEDGLEKVFSNLISNAVKYTPSNGKVSIELVAGQDRITLKIADSGIGIPQEDLPKIGEEFHRAVNAKRLGITGTGLGLHIVKQYMDQFKGKISVQSQEGSGTTFTLEWIPSDLLEDQSQ